MAQILAALHRLDARLDKVDLTLVRQEGQLAEHIRRTALAEEAIDLMRKDIAPVKTHVAVVGAVAKVLVTLVGLGGALVGIIRALG